MISIDIDLALRQGAHMPPYFMQPRKRKPARATLNAKQKAARKKKWARRLRQRKGNRG